MGPSAFRKLAAPVRHYSGRAAADWRVRAREGGGFTAVLCYHRVLADPAPAHLFDVERGLPADIFERQIRFMLKYFQPIKPSEVMTSAESGAMRFAVTFDDGYEDNYSVAAPILERLGVSAAFFVVRDFVGQDRRFWWERLAGLLRGAKVSRLAAANIFPPETQQQVQGLSDISLETLKDKSAAQGLLMQAFKLSPHREIDARLDKLAAALGVEKEDRERDFPLMDWRQLKGLRARGFEIGGHTATHCNLGCADEADFAEEVVDATAKLETDLEEEVRLFAYPYGRRQNFSAAAVKSLDGTNVKLAFTTEGGVVDSGAQHRLLPRFQLNRTQPFVWAYNVDKALKAPAIDVD